MIKVEDDDEEEESEFLSARLPEIGFGFGAEFSDGDSLDLETSTTSGEDDDGLSLVPFTPFKSIPAFVIYLVIQLMRLETDCTEININ